MIDVTVMVYFFGYLLVVFVCDNCGRAGINRMYIVADAISLWSPI